MPDEAADWPFEEADGRYHGGPVRPPGRRDPNTEICVLAGGTEATMMAAVPGSSFFKEPVNHLIRMHFARGTDVLDEAVHRLAKLTELLKYSSCVLMRNSRKLHIAKMQF